MKKEKIEELKNEIFNHVISFDRNLFDRDWAVDDRMRKMGKAVDGAVDHCIQNNYDDFDFWVFVTYRKGKLRSKNSAVKILEPKSLVEVLEEGIKLPEETSMVEIKIKPVIFNDFNRNVFDCPIYETKFGLGKEEGLTPAQLKRRYGLGKDDNLYLVDDMKENSRILKFVKKNKKHKDTRERIEYEYYL